MDLRGNFKVAVSGGSSVEIGTHRKMPEFEIRLQNEKKTGSGCVKTYKMTGWVLNPDKSRENTQLEIKVDYQFFSENEAHCPESLRQTVTVKNIGKKVTRLERVNGLTFPGIGADGLLKWYDPERFLVHTCDGTWEGEAQWRHRTFHELGLVPATTHESFRCFRVDSVGSWTTGQNYPILILEDRETGKSYFVEAEVSGSWEIDVHNVLLKPNDFMADGCLQIEVSGADFTHDNWYRDLKPGESYVADPVMYGICEGGFEEAIGELLKMKRKTDLSAVQLEALHEKNGQGKMVLEREGYFRPVVYNCYMNGIWSAPTTEHLIPLIDRAAECGSEVFCIDAGWFRSPSDESRKAIGDYYGADELFPGYGLAGILNYMKKKGMAPGLWIEAECMESKGDAFTLDPQGLCLRNGKVLGGNRAFFNFKNAKVREHLHRVIADLYGLGVRYIKNDYNQTTGGGFNNDGGSFSGESQQAIRAMWDFFDKIREEFPDLLIENCGSGGMREDHGTLKHFALQSTSDQEIYFRNPSIISGSLGIMAPEKAGAWAFPYPVLYPEMKQAFEDPLFWRKKEKLFKDGRETVFNMANGMLGLLYLSGRIDRADDKNKKLIQEGVSLYKNIRSFVASAHPVWPEGTFFMDDEGIFCTGLVKEEDRRMLLCVWNIKAPGKTKMIHLKKWGASGARRIYPKKSTLITDSVYEKTGKELGNMTFGFSKSSGILSIQAGNADYSAALFEILL